MANEKRLIDANVLKALFDERYDDAFMQYHTRAGKSLWWGFCGGINWGRNTIADAPTVDAVEVVRCKDCEHWLKDVHGCTDFVGRCGFGDYMVGATGYCVYGEMKANCEIAEIVENCDDCGFCDKT